jgi:hypothetical protein
MAVWIAAGVLGLLGVVVTIAGLRGARRRPMLGGTSALAGLLLVATAAAVGLAGINLNTYDRLSYEQYVARIELAQEGPQQFKATVRTPDGAEKTFELKGDDWQLDARVIKFPTWANKAGLNALYRLDRIAGRYDDIGQEAERPRTAFALSENPGLDVWKLARQYGEPLQIDTSFGSSVYHPMTNGAAYEVSMTQSALVSRPINEAATKAVGAWDGRDK